MENSPAAGRWYLARGTDLLNDDSGDPRTAAAFSVLMAARKQGQQFTLAHLESLLTQAGFVDLECHSTSPLHCVVIGRKP